MPNAGYKTVVRLSPDNTTYTEVDGIKSASFNGERVVLDVTDFKSTGILREKLMGLRDATFELSGDFVAGDAGQELFLDAADSSDDNPTLWIEILFDGTVGVRAKITAESHSISSEVEGLAAFSASGSLNGSFARI